MFLLRVKLIQRHIDLHHVVILLLDEIADNQIKLTAVGQGIACPASGSGKSTMMNIIGCLDVADAGQYLLDGLPIESYTENQLAKIRNEKIGFVFQQFNLIQKLSAEENVELPLIYQKVPRPERQRRVKEALEKVNLYARAKHQIGRAHV